MLSNQVKGIVGDSAGNLYLADSINNFVLKVPAGDVERLLESALAL